MRRPLQYGWSFSCIVDLLAVLPSFISLFTAANYVMVIRVLRLLRIFRILKLAHFPEETEILVEALRASRRKILVFIFAVVTLVIILGTATYFIEGEENGFDIISHGAYGAIVTLTTVGYGDVAPRTPLGGILASIIMIVGYGIIAVPTGTFFPRAALDEQAA